MTLPDGSKIQVLAPIVRGRKGEHTDRFDSARKKGFARVRIDGEIISLDEEIKLNKNRKHSIEIVVDRIVLKDGIRPRLSDSVETAMDIAEGLVVISGENEPVMP